ncbi:MAG TPA: SRPBCC family protein [Trueperaceae bacterium]|nr:SRPBCC family protein [Trueperaceae bacterium]
MEATQTIQVSQPSDLEVEITRSFTAPRELVFAAFTEPELIKQWMLGPGDWSMPVCEVDLRAGGGYRHVWRKPGVPDMGLTGKFLEVTQPERLVATEEFDQDWTGGATTVTTTFDDRAGTTVVTTRVKYASEEARDAAVRSGMADGMEAGYRRLDDVLSAPSQ